MSVTQDYKISLSAAEQFEVLHALRTQIALYQGFTRYDDSPYWVELLAKSEAALAAVLKGVVS